MERMQRRRDNSSGSIVTNVLVLISLLFSIVLLGHMLGWFGEAAQVAQEQFGPRAMLKKYETFKDQAAALDAKRANIEASKARMKNMEQTYAGVPRTHWARPDLEQYNLWSTEVAGMLASYNDLAAQYNAEMAKVNWRFANAGDLPAGATVPLPREFKPYESQ